MFLSRPRYAAGIMGSSSLSSATIGMLAGRWGRRSGRVIAPPCRVPLTPGAGYLLGGGVEAVEQVGHADHEHDRGQFLLVVMIRGGVPDRVRDRVGAVGQPGGGLGQRQRGPLAVGEIR